MKLLILSCNTGGGHNSAAKALQACAERWGIACDIQNALSFVPPQLEQLLTKGHVYLYRKHPKVYGFGYRFGEDHPSASVYKSFSPYARAIMEYILAGQYDAVISVHVFAALMTSAAKQETDRMPPTYFVATDYCCSPSVEQLDVDAWFIPKGLTGVFARAGIPADRLRETGIPVGTAYFESHPRAEARKLLGLPGDAPVILIASGSMGAGHLRPMILRLLLTLPRNTLFAVLTGTNEKLFNFLNLDWFPARLLPQTFTDKVPQWMAAADITITKPGGLTSTEAMAIRTPVVFMNAVPGPETHNMDFLSAQGCALASHNERELVRSVRRLLFDPAARAEMRKAQTEYTHENAAEEILRTIL